MIGQRWIQATRFGSLRLQVCGVAVDMESHVQNGSWERQFPPHLHFHEKTYRESGSDRWMGHLIVGLRHKAARIVPHDEAANEF